MNFKSDFKCKRQFQDERGEYVKRCRTNLNIKTMERSSLIIWSVWNQMVLIGSLEGHKVLHINITFIIIYYYQNADSTTPKPMSAACNNSWDGECFLSLWPFDLLWWVQLSFLVKDIWHFDLRMALNWNFIKIGVEFWSPKNFGESTTEIWTELNCIITAA